MLSGSSFLLWNQSCSVWDFIPGSPQPKYVSVLPQNAPGGFPRHIYHVLKIIIFGEAPDLTPGDITKFVWVWVRSFQASGESAPRVPKYRLFDQRSDTQEWVEISMINKNQTEMVDMGDGGKKWVLELK